MVTAHPFVMLYLAMRSLGKRYGYPTHFHGSYRKPRMRIVEHFAHELAHGVVLSGFPMSPRAIASEIHVMDDCYLQDRTELTAQRVEVAAMRRLGFRISIRRLARDALWSGGDPPRILLTSPLDGSEVSLVDRFVQIVRDELNRCV